MKGVYIINYAVKGIKNLDEWASLSFYKKAIRKNFDIRKYNIKGIYGVNGAGKSAIIRSVSILKALILDSNYLIVPAVQKQMNDLINKKTKKLEIKTDFLAYLENKSILCHYEISIEKNRFNRYQIDKEQLSYRNALSHTDEMQTIYHIKDGELQFSIDDQYSAMVIDQTKNLLENASLPSLWITKKELALYMGDKPNQLWIDLSMLILFASNLCVYMDSGDDHSDYYIHDVMKGVLLSGKYETNTFGKITVQLEKLSEQKIGLSAGLIKVEKKYYDTFKMEVEKLSEFLRVFKDDLRNVKIERKVNKNTYLCSLILDYGDYSLNAEFESTGIKKLIQLYDYLDRMMNGYIVFIDELDSNLHDVYLCALLEYLMENGEGQLCFTTHNIGPMDVLKRNKKSIDFLSTDHRIYSWTKNGNYSPSKLYKNGMIEGSPFNIFSFDFINSFYTEEGDN